MNDTWNAMAAAWRKILQMLRKEDMSAGDIASHFNISKPSITHHLNLLQQAGLVDPKREWQNIIYSTNTTVLQDLISFIADLKGENEG